MFIFCSSNVHVSVCSYLFLAVPSLPPTDDNLHSLLAASSQDQVQCHCCQLDLLGLPQRPQQHRRFSPSTTTQSSVALSDLPHASLATTDRPSPSPPVDVGPCPGAMTHRSLHFTTLQPRRCPFINTHTHMSTELHHRHSSTFSWYSGWIISGRPRTTLQRH